MKISFLVTYYNQEAFVRQSLDSILAMEKPEEWEILVGDDGSSDGTVEAVNAYIRQYPDNIWVYGMPREAGAKYDSVKRASANRLNLLAHCTGDCFCTLDGDDFYFDQDFVREAVAVMSAHEEVSCVLYGFSYFRDGALGEEVLLPCPEGRVDKAEYLEKLYTPAGAGVHRTNHDPARIAYLKKIGFFDDNNIVMNSLHDGDMYYINRSVYAYRQTGNSIYNRMNRVEQAVLNVQGYDVDKQLLDASLNGNLLRRYASSLLTMYLWRNQLREVLGEERYEKYLKSCSGLKDAVSYQLLRWADLSPEEKKKLGNLMNTLKAFDRTAYYKLRVRKLMSDLRPGQS